MPAANMRIRAAALALAATLIAQSAWTESDPSGLGALLSCDNTGQSDNCAPFYACLQARDGGEDLFFSGRAYGWGQGELLARNSAGGSCRGTWRAGGEGGAFSAQCDDGRSFTGRYVYQHPPTGTAVAQGSSNLGEPLVAWSGRNVPDYLKTLGDGPAWARACGLRGVPTS